MEKKINVSSSQTPSTLTREGKSSPCLELRRALTFGLGREGKGKFGKKFVVLKAVFFHLCPEAVLGKVLSHELYKQTGGKSYWAVL